MAVTVSALDRALMLPELISTILSGLHDDAPTLAACMRVNKLWAEEAVMFLWEACGSDASPPNGRRQLPPKIRNLAALAPYPDRLQWYARCIRTLNFTVEYTHTDGMRDTPKDASGDDAQYHLAFANTEFPRLECFRLQGSGYGSVQTKGSSLLQYLQPSLRAFCLLEGSLSDDFFISMKVWYQSTRLLIFMNFLADVLQKSRCPALNTLVIDLEQQCDEITSDAAFLDCLQALKSLELLSLCHGLGNAWSLNSFLGVAKHRSLKRLALPVIPLPWLRELDNNGEGRSFTHVEDFDAHLSENGLELVVPHLANTTKLEIYIIGPSSQALRIAATAPALRSLKLTFGANSVIHERDLILFAETHSALESLDLGSEDQENIPSADDITDTTIDQVARLLPKLETLQICLADATLTEASLLSLGTFCKYLETCDISGDFFFEGLVRNCQPNLFPALRTLWLIQPLSDRRQYTDPEETARQFVQVAPNLRSLDFDYENSTESDTALQDAVSELTRTAR